MIKSEAKVIIKKLHKLQDDIYWGKISLFGLTDQEYRNLDEPQKTNIIIWHRLGAVAGIQEAKNKIRNMSGLKKKCSWRDYYNDMGWDFDTTCGHSNVSIEPGKYCPFCGREIE